MTGSHPSFPRKQLKSPMCHCIEELCCVRDLPKASESCSRLRQRHPNALLSFNSRRMHETLRSIGIYGQFCSLNGKIQKPIKNCPIHHTHACQVCTCTKESMCIKTWGADLRASIWAVQLASMARAALLHLLERRRSPVPDS